MSQVYRRTMIEREADLTVNGVYFKKVGAESGLTPRQILSNLQKQHRWNCKLMYPVGAGYVCKVHGNYVHIVE